MKIIIFVLISLQISFVNASSKVGNGSDEQSTYVWFYDDDVVLYCIKVPSNEEFTIPRFQEIIEASVKKWKKYYQEKILKDLRFVDEHKVNFNFAYQENCNGSENISFYIGLEDEKIIDVKKSFVYPSAFAWREEFDSVSLKGKGIVWVSEDYLIKNKYNRSALEIILTHELGHVFGNPHVEGTIMDKDAHHFYMLEMDNRSSSEIDQNRELYTNRNTKQESKDLVFLLNGQEGNVLSLSGENLISSRVVFEQDIEPLFINYFGRVTQPMHRLVVRQSIYKSPNIIMTESLNSGEPSPFTFYSIDTNETLVGSRL
ncbi:MAG: hypothetical protein HON90_11930 [Halobacteriovoraceae bacterium]|jgi:hypothetical protein|nr:hypothetical protein [Halobacteriovoraceae bacterium]